MAAIDWPEDRQTSDRQTPTLLAVNSVRVSAVALGDSAVALGDSAVALGDSAVALGDSAVALGDSAVALPACRLVWLTCGPQDFGLLDLQLRAPPLPQGAVQAEPPEGAARRLLPLRRRAGAALAEQTRRQGDVSFLTRKLDSGQAELHQVSCLWNKVYLRA
ncbi:hypothetical protein EYF80_059096 [Liparis tanakae]|uniref:Trimeric autotransporter adhesin YadA-like head domain-containing protein n=1 Tax=Liparis tanakae TaxID=230148 RepID=A0A4Z2ER34_9TELE|nr:hypothetical protein EYF80_059096 [Liparis tanakae]